MKLPTRFLHAARCSKMLCKGFSLAEVTIALAIAAGGFVSLLGMIPQGLEMSRRSSAMSAKTRMVDIIAGQLTSTAWQELSWAGHSAGTTGMRKYFDDQAIELTEADLTSGAMLSYVVSVYLPDSSGDVQSVKLPNASSATPIVKEKYSKRAFIFIAETTDQNFQFPLPGTLLPKNVSYQAIILPEMGVPKT